ncbi:MAG TPA: biotin/lipoyl-containing protein, partial [Chloroflexota bacterium]|nr:biotin/lipoyl-containing protein [Chloroflexota bacterium]
MAQFEFRVADVGEGIHEVEILEWKVKPGDLVRAFDPLCEVESAKAAVELTAPVAGRISETRVPVGGTARVGDVLVVIETAESTEFASPQSSPPSEAEEPPGEEWFGIVGAPPRPTPLAAPTAAPTENTVRAAPLVRKLARERGIRLEDVIGTGPEGRVRLADLEADQPHSAQVEARASAAPTPSSPNGEERIPLRGLRKRIAEHLTEAIRRAPQVTAIDLFDVTDLVRAREFLRPAAEREGIKLTYLPFVVKA